MPPARCGHDVFSPDNVVDICRSEASVFSDDDPLLDKSDLMDLEEFMFIHKSKSKNGDPPSYSSKATNGDFLSQLLKNVQQNLGLKFDKSQENSVNDVSDDDDSESEKNDNCALLDHEYVTNNESIENETNENYQRGKQQGRKRKPRTYKYNPKPVQQKTHRSFVPDKLKNDEYWERRKRNNQAAKKSREDRRRKELEVLEKMAKLEKHNSELIAKVERLEKRNEMLEMQLQMRGRIDS